MRIVQLVQKPQRRGAEVFAYQLTQTLRRQRHDVRIVYLYSDSGTGELPRHSDDIVLHGQSQHIFERVPGWHPKLVQNLKKAIYEFQPDIVQLNGARTVKYGALLRSLDGEARWALIYRNIGDPKDWLHGSLKRNFYRKFVMPKIDGIVAVSNGSLEFLRSFYKPNVPTIVIPTGFDCSALLPSSNRNRVRENLSVKPDTPVLIFVGSLTSEKRVDRLFRIIQKAMRELPELKLWLVGDGLQRAQFERESKLCGIGGAVLFLGIRDDLASLLYAADVFVLTSDTEGIPASILEAGFCALPVIATRIGGIPECVRDGETGFLVDPKNEEEFSELIVRLLKAPQERETLGLRAKDWVTKNFSMDIIANQYLDFYQSIIGHFTRRVRNS